MHKSASHTGSAPGFCRRLLSNCTRLGPRNLALRLSGVSNVGTAGIRFGIAPSSQARTCRLQASTVTASAKKVIRTGAPGPGDPGDLSVERFPSYFNCKSSCRMISRISCTRYPHRQVLMGRDKCPPHLHCLVSLLGHLGRRARGARAVECL